MNTDKKVMPAGFPFRLPSYRPAVAESGELRHCCYGEGRWADPETCTPEQPCWGDVQSLTYGGSLEWNCEGHFAIGDGMGYSQSDRAEDKPELSAD